MTLFQKARKFVYQNARPLDIFRFQYLLENGSRENVLKALKMYQNDDGTWNIIWSWGNFLEEWSISKNWWESDIIINNLKYLRGFNKLDL